MTSVLVLSFLGHGLLPRWRGVFPRLSRWLGSAPWLSSNCTINVKQTLGKNNDQLILNLGKGKDIYEYQSELYEAQ